VENCAIPTYQAVNISLNKFQKLQVINLLMYLLIFFKEKLKQMSPTSSEFEIEMESMKVTSREAILSRSRSSTSTLARTADMDTWGLSCLTTNELIISSGPNDQVHNGGDELYDEEAEKFEKILAQLF
jgi:hypothetical protein